MSGNNLYFVLGGARSGKSGFASGLAERKAGELGLRPVYLATAPASYAGAGAEVDASSLAGCSEMAARIDAHKESRGDGWDTIEEPVALEGVVAEASAEGVLMIDCLTLWIANLMEQGLADDEIAGRAEALASAAAKAANPVIVVSNEVGQGIVPASSLARRFRDVSGIVNQRAAARAKEVYFVTAGLEQKIKG